MPNRVLLPGLAISPVILVCVIHHAKSGETGLPIDHDALPLWAVSCCLALFGLAAARLLASVHTQHQHTKRALAPLLTLPTFPAPATFSSLLQTRGLAGSTQLIDLSTPVALCYGLLKPKLLFSRGVIEELSSTEVEAVLCHEQAHLRRRDPLRLVLARALADTLPLLPMMTRMAGTMLVAQELAADRSALATVKVEALAGALLKLGDALSPAQGNTLAIGSFGEADARIAQLLGDPLPSLRPSFAMVLPIVLALAASPFLCVLFLLINLKR